jgi:hypothetical protein
MFAAMMIGHWPRRTARAFLQLLMVAWLAVSWRCVLGVAPPESSHFRR